MKNFWSNFKAQFSLPHIVFLLLASVLIIPVLVWLLRKVPGVDKALEKVPGAGAAMVLAGLLALGMTSAANAAPVTDAPAIVQACDAATPLLATVAPVSGDKMIVALFALAAAGVVTVLAVRCKRAAATFALSALMIAGLLQLFAADTSPFARAFTSLVIQQGTTADSQTNSFRVYDTTRTNFFQLNSNATPVYVNGGVSNYTAQDISVYVTNSGVAWRLTFKKGFLTATN